ncbi:hypothetical protein EVAR_8667_1 [Eumeta japonica]|uniref:Uncharacterized protein n=1 Tax=Eumeta variegata TaxID=151549 RepID=A0A4C1TUJ1_EUMVA|nr:hypothetical protein EVAR_8667_1 [Eumeta japonica]
MPLTTNEFVDIINNLNSDDEATGINIYIDPPGGGLVSGLDSGDKTNVRFDHLSRRQLLAPDKLSVELDMTTHRKCSNQVVDIAKQRQPSIVLHPHLNSDHRSVND